MQIPGAVTETVRSAIQQHWEHDCWDTAMAQQFSVLLCWAAATQLWVQPRRCLQHWCGAADVGGLRLNKYKPGQRKASNAVADLSHSMPSRWNFSRVLGWLLTRPVLLLCSLADLHCPLRPSLPLHQPEQALLHPLQRVLQVSRGSTRAVAQVVGVCNLDIRPSAVLPYGAGT